MFTNLNIDLSRSSNLRNRKKKRQIKMNTPSGTCWIPWNTPASAQWDPQRQEREKEAEITHEEWLKTFHSWWKSQDTQKTPNIINSNKSSFGNIIKLTKYKNEGFRMQNIKPCITHQRLTADFFSETVEFRNQWDGTFTLKGTDYQKARECFASQLPSWEIMGVL